MTKRERAQLVELLRCAGDIAVNGDRDAALGSAAVKTGILCGLADSVRISHLDHWTALLNDLVRDCEGNGWLVCGPGYEFCLLEAAARVEEGSYP